MAAPQPSQVPQRWSTPPTSAGSSLENSTLLLLILPCPTPHLFKIISKGGIERFRHAGLPLLPGGRGSTLVRPGFHGN
ncbi:hypothetical protein I79_009759 [Cricetulus griseus]|uniref:Uncharacterized protein n=1 Tax=Cricetulus griseus TaxID=10029 RepID=G3HGM2_CRIGR|nr:hypothetical protein I79_009759 [Cricetulus griseus]